VIARIAWGYFGFTTHEENTALTNMLEEMVILGKGTNWDGLKGFTPYPRFYWLFDLYANLYSEYPEFMVNYFPSVVYETLRWSAAAFGVGFLTPISGPLYCLMFNLYFYSMGESRFVNHFYMKGLIIFLLCWTRCGRAWSVDSLLKGIWRKYKGKEPNYTGDKTCPKWNIILIRAQVAVIFFFATSSKIQEDWLRGQPWKFYISRPYRSRAMCRWLLDVVFGSADGASEAYGLFISHAGIFYDGIIVPILVYLTFRPLEWSNNYQSIFVFSIFVISSTIFHTSNAYITQHIGQFPMMTWVLYSLFFQYNWPSLIIQWLIGQLKLFGILPTIENFSEFTTKSTDSKSPIRGRKKKKSSKKSQKSDSTRNSSLTWTQWFVIILIIFWLGFQIYVPTLHLWSKHRPLWVSSYYFGWRMMMTHFTVETAELYVNHPVSNRTMITIPLKDFHISDAVVDAIGNAWHVPKYVGVVANHVADKIEAEKGERPKVYANVIAAQNFRRLQSRFQPGVDLASVGEQIYGYEEFLADELPLTEEQWNEMPWPLGWFIRKTNFPIWG